MSNLKLNKLTIENFRVFNGSKEFIIDSDKPIVLLYGNNGFGKTSFFDACEWGMTGKLARYKGSSKERNEYLMLRNHFATNTGNPAKVSILLDHGQELTRTVRPRGHGDYNEGNLEGSLIGQLVKSEWSDIVDFSQAFNLSHILTQELVNKFIRSTKDTDRYNSIVSLFGLDGYSVFDPKFQEISKIAEVDLDITSTEIKIKEDEINNNKEFLSSGDIDGNALKTDLAKSLAIDINAFQDLQDILSDIQKRISDNDSDFELLKEKLLQINFLEQNWQSGLTANQRIKELGDILSELPKLLTLIDSLDAGRWILNSKDDYLEYCKEKNAVSRLENELNTLTQSAEGRLLQTTVIGLESDITQLFLLGSSLDENMQVQIEKLKEVVGIRDTRNAELEKIEQILDAKFGLEKRLLQLAKEFLVDNPDTEQCPVCKNNIDSNKLLSDLQLRLAKDSSDFFKETIDNRFKLQRELFQLTEQIDIITSNTVDTLNTVRLTASQKQEELHKQLEIAKELSETGKKIESWLSYMETDISHIGETCLQVEKSIQESLSFVKEQFSKDFYQKRQGNLTEELKNLQNQNEYFIQLVSTYSPTSVEDVSQKKLDLNAQNENLLKQKAQFNHAQEIVISLQKNERYILAKTRIVDLEKQINPLRKKLAKLELIPQYCHDLRQKARSLIEEDTRKLLTTYGSTMDTIYSHLNPHTHLEKFKFRIDASNPSNNRLILEALQKDGDIKMNPTYTFSSAQTNVVAISIFLGIALQQQWSNLNAIFLDDPIQNMDDINVHSFVDIIRSVTRETDKQFFISTHDERVFNFMKRKFRNTAQVFRFTGYGEFVKEYC